MQWTIECAVRLATAANRVASRKWSFTGLFIVAFFGSVIALRTADLLPEPLPAQQVSAIAAELPAAYVASSTESAVPIVVAEQPIKVEIPKIGLSATVANPTTTDVDALDKLLLKGAVRYPTSAELGVTGNVVLFGHSSYLPVVINQAYKTFDGIQKLTAGDTVTVYSATTAYTYRVRSVAKESANDAAIQLNVLGKVLTLSTCDSFGATTDRFVMTADFVESHLISA